ncbi:uncharacterized protein BDZ99DRAFT_460206 [Mytilinidion resinicola]|uniref:Uncharacterized protein n=1 Tax=Mytilinidion resinicola TaxID=574789 RepID=A0A6A6YV69_9PEZI|nr:uncharacterized protein BDZ99DRAFT_460206 [Mytilinidion resinicola]KAF2812846.1 hypothetical protein BDZ99DRAFT_460206 [Mytilinidion resinicola]
MRTSLQQTDQGRGTSLQQPGLSIGMRVLQPPTQTVGNPLQQSNQRQNISSRQLSGSTNITAQSNVPNLDHGNVQTEARASAVRRMRNPNPQDTIQVRPRISSAPNPTAYGPTLLPSPLINTPTSVPSRLVPKARESLGSDDSTLSSGPSHVSTPVDMQFSPTAHVNGKEKEKSGTHLPRLQTHPHSPLSSAPSNPTTPQDMGFTIPAQAEGMEKEIGEATEISKPPPPPQTQVSTRRTSVQSITDYAPFDPALLSQDCVITYAKAGPWNVAPTAGEAVRQVRGAKGGVFREEEIVFGVRFLVG